MKFASPRLFATFCLSFLLLVPTSGSAQSDPALIRRVDDHYNHLRTLRAHYTEHYKGMGLDRTESGTLTLKKPGLMRWSYNTPPGKVFVLDGHYAWFYMPGDAQVTRTPAKQLDDLRSPLRFLLGHTQLAKELDHLTTTPAGANFLITGIPKGMAERVHTLSLIVSPAGTIQSMKIEETDGALTDFTFTSIDENVPVPANDFVFTPPTGITIVNGQSPI
ncbi:MAG: outer membrane lipoprotein carrier protein LolA [Acidobacteriota bacterium]|nr:outer membrane lipoprotein carrier protein LolA [Acidobacteriota bacterium]